MAEIYINIKHIGNIIVKFAKQAEKICNDNKECKGFVTEIKHPIAKAKAHEKLNLVNELIELYKFKEIDFEVAREATKNITPQKIYCPRKDCQSDNIYSKDNLSHMCGYCGHQWFE